MQVAAIIGGLLFVLALGACDGDGAAGPDATATPLPTADPAGVDLERFHYVASLALHEQRGADARDLTITTEGDFQQPDRHAFTYRTESGEGAIERSVVIIGPDAWLREPGGEWEALAADDPRVAELVGVAFSTARARFLGGPEFVQVRDNVRALASTPDFVNGVATDHYTVAGAGLEYFETFIASDELIENVDDLAWDLWLAGDGGWPVRLRASATITADLEILEALGLVPPTTWELQIDVSQPGDPAIEIVPPDA